jgi:predicted small integral membrane protein
MAPVPAGLAPIVKQPAAILPIGNNVAMLGADFVGDGMIAIRIAKIVMVAAIAFFATLVAFGNVTDYWTNFAFVQHVMSMDTIFPNSAITYRAITSPALHHLAYVAIIATEIAIAALCGIGAWNLLQRIWGSAAAFNGGKSIAVFGLLLGFLLWQVGFMTVGGEWFGMWESKTWNGIESAFHFVAVIAIVLVFVALPDGELAPVAGKRPAVKRPRRS